MIRLNSTKPYKVLRCNAMVNNIENLDLIGEEPLLIRIEDKDYAVIMRTPGDEQAHAAGFCLGEGVISRPCDIKTLGYDDQLEPNVVNVWLTRERKAKAAHVLDRRAFISQTSCGICGKKMINDMNQMVRPPISSFKVSVSQVFLCIQALTANQRYYQRTRGSHAAVIFDSDLSMLSFAEDVGRHNSLDKAVGKAFLAHILHGASLLILSSRISYELIQKSARAGISVIISNSRPTALAVDMGKSMGMTLAFPTLNSELMVVCGRHRILTDN